MHLLREERNVRYRDFSPALLGFNEKLARRRRDVSGFDDETTLSVLLRAAHKFACFEKQVKLSGETRWREGRKKIGETVRWFFARWERNIGHPGTARNEATPADLPFKKSGQYFPRRRGAFKCMYSYARVSLWREVWSKLFKLTRTLFSPLGLGHFLAPLHPRITSRPSFSPSISTSSFVVIVSSPCRAL